jgi:hypothetical protein
MNMLKFQKFLLSNKNIFGFGFASIIVLLGFIGIVKSFWIPISLMAYVFGYLLAPKDKEIKFFHFKGENLEDYIGFINKLSEKINSSEKLPQDSKSIIINIIANANELLKFLQQKSDINEFNEDMINLKAIFDSYLPKIVNQYERLPVKYATQVKTSNGKTAKEMLIEQLTLLQQKMTEISYGMYEDDVTALKVNGRFLKQKFEQTNLFILEKEINS